MSYCIINQYCLEYCPGLQLLGRLIVDAQLSAASLSPEAFCWSYRTGGNLTTKHRVLLNAYGMNAALFYA